MPLELHPITIEDCPAIATLYFEASAHRNLFNGTAQPAALQERFRQNLANTLNACAGEVMCQKRIFKVIDTDLAGKPISWGRWTIPDTENQASEEDETKIDPLQGPPIPGYNISLRAAFIKEIESMRARALKGTKHYLLENLATHPSHSRRGAATMLLTWPFEQADKEGLIIYLDTDAESKARRMYERYGFIKVDECHLNLQNFGGEGMHTHIGMIRYPGSA